MKRYSSQSMHVVKREEKETNLIKFVLGEIAAGRVSLSGQWTVVALSMDSPVVAALNRVIADLGEASELQLRIVLTARQQHKLADQFGVVGAVSVRVSQNMRMLDAHEQLVLGDRTSWTGDCMRRNPRERDAFETFASDDDLSASWAIRSFERIWQSGVSLKGSGITQETTAADISITDLVAGEGVKANPVVSATSKH